jgi:hypothetical protein
MGRFLNPFRKYDVDDFPSVIVPLAKAPRHPSVIAENKRRASRASIDSAANAEKGEKSVDGSETAEFTVEQLKAEVEEDIVASGHDSAYDRKSKVINKAIMDIGMGRYQVSRWREREKVDVLTSTSGNCSVSVDLAGWPTIYGSRGSR